MAAREGEGTLSGVLLTDLRGPRDEKSTFLEC